MSAEVTSMPQPSTADRSRQRLRMKDLCEATGLERQAIHFYIQQGLLPPGEKTGRNMAWYDPEHLERLQLIKRLQNEQFLPLKAIKALLDGRDGGFTPEQQAFLTRVKSRLGPRLEDGEKRDRWVDGEALAARAGIEMKDLEEAIEIGAVGARRRDDDRWDVVLADAWMIELFGQMRRLGFTRELGFTVKDVLFYEEAVSRLFQEEVRLISGRLAEHPPERVAEMIERALPVIHTFLTRFHASRVREFFDSL